MATYSLPEFKQEDKDFIISLKKQMKIDGESINKLWEIHLMLLGKYPRYERGGACGACINYVLNDCHVKALEWGVPAPVVELKKDTKKVK